jgi:hypothetical protein
MGGRVDRFVGVILICFNTTPPDACTEKTAVDVISGEVSSELGCIGGWQEDIGRSALRDEIGRTAYVKTLCRRIPADNAKPRQ